MGIGRVEFGVYGGVPFRNGGEIERRERMEKQKRVSGMELRGYRKDKIFEAVEKCVEAMSELTIAESKVARQQLDSVMEEMYKRSPDTIIGTIQHSLQA